MARKKKSDQAPKGKAAAPATAQAQTLPLFERPEEGVVQIRVAPAATDRLAGFREAFEDAQNHYDKGSTANGKARERIKAIAKSNGIATSAINDLRKLLRMDAKDAIAHLNDLTLLAAWFGIFDAAEQADQAEANEANAASMDAAEREPIPPAGEAPAAVERLNGAPPKGVMEAVFYQGQEAHIAGAALDDCPADFNPGQAGWWKEGWRRQEDQGRIANARTSSGAISAPAN